MAINSFKITIDNRDFTVLCLPNRPKALLDRTVARIYEVPTWRINEAVKRNPEKFPEDFCFELTPEEVYSLNEIDNCDQKSEPIAICDGFKTLKHSSALPKAFTHLGCNMLATILKSRVAVQRAIQIIRTFTALENGNIAQKIQKLEEGQQALFYYQENVEMAKKQIQRRLESLEEKMKFLPKTRPLKKRIPLATKRKATISDSQIQRLKELVTEKARSEGCQIMGIWADFKKHFGGLTRYKFLPAECFGDAVKWLEK